MVEAKPIRRIEWSLIVFALLALALPWAVLAYLAAPGGERPLLSNVLSLFVIADALVAQWGVERAFERRHPAPAFIAFGLSTANAFLLALRLRGHGGDATMLLIHLGAIAAVTLLGILLYGIVFPRLGWTRSGKAARG